MLGNDNIPTYLIASAKWREFYRWYLNAFPCRKVVQFDWNATYFFPEVWLIIRTSADNALSPSRRQAIRKVTTLIEAHIHHTPQSVKGKVLWSNLLVICIFPAASAQKHILMSPPYQMIYIYIYIYIFANSRCKNPTCVPSRSDRLTAVTNVWYRSTDTNPFLTDGLWRNGLHAGHHGGWRKVSLRFSGCGNETKLHFMKQFVHNWHLPYSQCAGTCSHVSSVHNNIGSGKCAIRRLPAGLT